MSGNTGFTYYIHMLAPSCIRRASCRIFGPLALRDVDPTQADSMHFFKNILVVFVAYTKGVVVVVAAVRR